MVDYEYLAFCIDNRLNRTQHQSCLKRMSRLCFLRKQQNACSKMLDILPVDCSLLGEQHWTPADLMNWLTGLVPKLAANQTPLKLWGRRGYWTWLLYQHLLDTLEHFDSVSQIYCLKQELSTTPHLSLTKDWKALAGLSQPNSILFFSFNNFAHGEFA